MEKEQLHVVVVDDSADDTLLLERELKRGEWEIILTRVDTREAMVQILAQKCCDLIICDYVIPGFGGMEALHVFNEYGLDIPFIMTSGKITEEIAITALQEGAQDFISKQNYTRLLPAIHRGIERMKIISERKAATTELRKSEIKYRLLADYAIDFIFWRAPDGTYIYISPACFKVSGYTPEEFISDSTLMERIIHSEDREKYTSHLHNLNKENRSELEFRLLHRDGSIRWISHYCKAIYDETGNYLGRRGNNRDITERKQAEINLHNSLLGTVRAISDIVEMRDLYTAGHQKRVALLACAIAKELGLSEERIEGLYLAAEIHDVGKIKIPTEILSKPTQLANIEYLLIQTHPEAAYNILKDIKFPWPIADIIRQHHEKLDGSGYPHGLKGDEIFLEARILTVADIVEAMASNRPYRPALGIEVALQEIQNERGTKLDAIVVDACIALFKENRFSF